MSFSPSPFSSVPRRLLDNIFVPEFSVAIHDDILSLSAMPILLLRNTTRSIDLSRDKRELGQLKIMLNVAHFKPSEIEVKTVDNYVVIHGKHEEKVDEHGFVSREFTRRYLLPEGVEPDTVKSELSPNGVLTIVATRNVIQLPFRNERIVPITIEKPAVKESIMPAIKRVAVIGAGPCGMGAVKNLKDEGIEPVCFERTGNLGGLWRYHDEDMDGIASVMKTTIINTSKELGAISEFPPPAHYPNYMHHTLMYQYMYSFAEKGDCILHIKFHHETKSIEKAEDYEETGRWKVTCKNTQTGEVVSDTFDAVCICIGHHVYPHEPTFPRQEEFEGKILHTHSLKKVDGYEDKCVVVVGVGNSGMDAAVELSAVAKKVYLSSRRGAWVLPRVGPKGNPFDATFVRRYKHLMQSYLPYNFICYVSEKQLNERFNHELYNLKPKHRVWSQHPTISDTLPIKLLSGVVVTRGGIKHFTKKGVVFDGEEEETEVDVVMLATGYKVKFPFLSDDVLPVKDNRVRLYKFVLPPHLPHDTLAILGLIQPNGPGFPCGKMQCRWTARIFSRKHSLPSREVKEADIEKKLDHIRKRFVDSPRHTLQVDFISYQDELAEEIGCKPNFLKLLITDPKLFWALLVGPSLPYQYRLQGPHTWEGARDAILSYKERVVTPLLKPGQKYIPRRRGLLRVGKIIHLLFILPILWLLYSLFFN